jgi:hypothetical protein
MGSDRRVGGRSVQNKRLKVYKTEEMGWGVKALEDIKQGQLVVEFVGEVIDDEECGRRMGHQKATGDNANFYMVDVGG